MKIDIYTQPNCPPCQWVKHFLTDKNIPFTEYDVSKDVRARKKLMTTYDCFSTPTVIIHDQNLVLTGQDIQQLEELLK